MNEAILKRSTIKVM